MASRWSRHNGYRDVLAVGLPLVVSFGTTSLIHFTDRVFLANYSVTAIAAALPAGIVSFLTLCFFMGVVSYVNVFVAQYVGARKPERVGASLWQGLYFSLAASLILASLYLVAEPLFSMSGHPPEVQRQEIIYFSILTLGAGLVVIATNLSCFYSGRGLTRPVMLANLASAGLNIPLDYILINGVWVFPEMGIAGAAVATVCSQGLLVVLFVCLIFRPKNNRQFAVWHGRAWERDLFARLMRYGLPGGVQFFIDIFAITFFVFMVGRLGKPELAATNIVFAISTLAFLPMVGMSVAVSTLVGQAIGSGRPRQAEVATSSTLHIALGYMICVASLFVLFPEFLLSMFGSSAQGGQYAQIMKLGAILLKFVAVYTVFDALAIVYFGALKGAGDIYFVMWSMGLLSLGIMIGPVLVGMELMGAGIYYTWTCATVYVSMLGIVFRLRYKQGKWKGMRIIEAAPVVTEAPEGMP